MEFLSPAGGESVGFLFVIFHVSLSKRELVCYGQYVRFHKYLKSFVPLSCYMYCETLKLCSIFHFTWKKKRSQTLSPPSQFSLRVFLRAIPSYSSCFSFFFFFFRKQLIGHHVKEESLQITLERRCFEIFKKRSLQVYTAWKNRLRSLKNMAFVKRNVSEIPLKNR